MAIQRSNQKAPGNPGAKVESRGIEPLTSSLPAMRMSHE
jgi:hypothetical protein